MDCFCKDGCKSIVVAKVHGIQLDAKQLALVVPWLTAETWELCGMNMFVCASTVLGIVAGDVRAIVCGVVV